MSNEIHEAIEEFGLIRKDKTKSLFSKIGIVGCGVVGQNIALAASSCGIEVVFLELNDEKISEVTAKMGRVLDFRIEHWGLTQGEKRAILSRITGTLDYSQLTGCDCVIEAVNAYTHDGNIAERKTIFKHIENVVAPDCIIATNSNTVEITELSSELTHRERTVCLHFLVSSPEAVAVEVVKGLYTSDVAYEKICQFVTMLRRKVIPVVESAGLVSVRLLVVLLNEACTAVMEGIASISDVDETMRIGLGMRMGPFEVADKIGLDKLELWMENVYNEFGDIRYKPSPLIKRLVRAKQTGVSAGKGFYKYDDNGHKIS
ncbi:MAG: 3-hydroxyacyl-CoA dehydrogenase family protein [Bacteroidales bacterium]|jgi:3-hydroxybutyryl-CoA dehydrogenase|nr:3-hydroxyacyl-CoA dehydrogenase family protein [Bacteroidales bacterium]